jgi:hypothetical protein
MFRKISLFILTILCASTIFAQMGKGVIFFHDTFSYEICFESSSSISSSQASTFFSQRINKLHQKGFLEARIDSFASDSLYHLAYAFLGPKYILINQLADSYTVNWILKSGIKKIDIERPIVNPFDIKTISNSLLNLFDANGHPFASLSLTNSTIVGNCVKSNLILSPGPTILLDTLYIKGDASINRKFIESYLGFTSGAKYNEFAIKQYDKKLRNLSFISVIRPTEVEFTPGKARVYTYISSQPRSSFSGILGFYSSNNSSSAVKVTGDINLSLVNTFKRGEYNSIQWQAPGEGSQRLNISSSWAYLFGSKVGLGSSFFLYRRDSSYININPKFTVNFINPKGYNLGLGFDYRSSSVISTINSSSTANSKTTIYKVFFNTGFKMIEVFPIKKTWLSAEFGVGHRSSGSGNDVSSIGELQFEYLNYYPLYKEKFVFYSRLNAKIQHFIMSSVPKPFFFDNEMYRLGGYGSLRGFNQESIITPAFIIANFELQYRVQNSLNFYLFFDNAIVSHQLLSNSQLLLPMGYGFGVQISSTGGLINLSYALGTGMGEGPALRNAKVHIGYNAYF